MRHLSSCFELYLDLDCRNLHELQFVSDLPILLSQAYLTSYNFISDSCNLAKEQNMTEAVILSGARTPVGKFLGQFKDLSAIDLGVIAARAAIERAGLDATFIDEVFMGNVVQ